MKNILRLNLEEDVKYSWSLERIHMELSMWRDKIVWWVLILFSLVSSTHTYTYMYIGHGLVSGILRFACLLLSTLEKQIIHIPICIYVVSAFTFAFFLSVFKTYDVLSILDIHRDCLHVRMWTCTAHLCTHAPIPFVLPRQSERKYLFWLITHFNSTICQ